jgi:hypothetical protein
MIPNYDGKVKQKHMTPWGRGCKYCSFNTWDYTYQKECPTDPKEKDEHIKQESLLLR